MPMLSKRVKPVKPFLPRVPLRPLMPVVPVPFPYVPMGSNALTPANNAAADSSRPSAGQSAGAGGEGSFANAPAQDVASEHVRWVQETLNRALGLRLIVDGIMNRETRSAVRMFQERKGLPVTGLVGPDTEEALRAEGGQAAAEPELLEGEWEMGEFVFEAAPFSNSELGELEKYAYAGGWFVNKGNLQWEEWQKKMLAFRFVESERDNEYIFLNDTSRNICVALPIKGGRSYYAYGGSDSWTDLYDITLSSNDFRARAIKLLAPLPPSPQEITSNGPQRNLFTQMTGLTQEMLQDAWAKGKNLTSCNAFTGWFSRAMGSKAYLGRFDLDAYAKKSWVSASSGRTPRYGDILRFKTFHVGIALDLVDGVLHTAEGGQGGPKRGFDAIKRKQMPWDPSKFTGWVDLEHWIQNGG